MRSLEDRGNSFENKFAHDEDLRFRVIARRNKLFGLWAAGEIGLEGDVAQDYALSIVTANLGSPGEAGVINKVSIDFKAKNLAADDGVIKQKLADFLQMAEQQLTEV